jgi:hypothetical protein
MKSIVIKKMDKISIKQKTKNTVIIIIMVNFHKISSKKKKKTTQEIKIKNTRED